MCSSSAFRVVLCECIRCVALVAFARRAFDAICISSVAVCCRQASQSRGSQWKSMSMCICACLIRHWLQASARPTGIVRERPGVCEWWVAGRVSVSRGARGRRMCVAVAGAVRVAGAAAMRTFLVNGNSRAFLDKNNHNCRFFRLLRRIADVHSAITNTNGRFVRLLRRLADVLSA